ncbi:MAG TPA: ABC transporter permease [bacterium]|nr:ABC transporter permease [bacterium]
MLGVRTLFSKEVRRFMRVYGQTIASPLITTSLYFVVFGYSIGHRVGTIEGVSYARFMVPGLVALGVIQNAFLNTSSSFFMMKLMGTITDLLVTPLSYGEILTGFISAAVLRALMVGALMWLVAAVFTGFSVANPFFVVAMLVMISVAFSALGLCVAIWAEQFEQVNFVPTFVITPLTFLGGVFYSASMLPPALRKFTLVNPLFYMVDGVRWGVLGISDASPLVGLGFVVGLATVCIGAALWMLRSGWKLRG